MGNEPDGGEADGLAPVIPLFGGARPSGTVRVTPEDAEAAPRPDIGGADAGWHLSWTDDQPSAPPAAADDAEVYADAEKALLRKLRGRSLSVREAQSLAREQGLDAELAGTLIDAFLARGYLDDARLADQLVHTGSERKGQGRQAIAQTLAKRGIPRDVADAALAPLADDDADRALEFARTKARSMRGLDRDVALRRLAGQLARRGYGGQSLDAARRALDELSRPAHGVRFE